MRRAITRVGVWLAVTAAAVGLSWFGVRTVLRDTVIEPPRTPELAVRPVDGPAPDPGTLAPAAAPAPAEIGQPTSRPRASSTARPAPSKAPAGTSAAPAADVRGQGGNGNARGYNVRGGRAVFDLGRDSASLITATPSSGWAVRVWQGDRWLRVDFTRGEATSSVFVSWNDHPPMVQTYKS